jgi:hypothetical protein
VIIYIEIIFGSFEKMAKKIITLTTKVYAPKAKSYDSKQLTMGISHEMEHTPSRRLAGLIAKNHLDEDPSYYTKLFSKTKY